MWDVCMQTAMQCTFSQFLATVQMYMGDVCMQAAMPHLLESKGAIVNISSVMSRQYLPAQIAYNASKAMQDSVRAMPI